MYNFYFCMVDNIPYFEQLIAFRSRKKFVDLYIHCVDDVVHAHRIILAAVMTIDGINSPFMNNNIADYELYCPYSPINVVETLDIIYRRTVTYNTLIENPVIMDILELLSIDISKIKIENNIQEGQTIETGNTVVQPITGIDKNDDTNNMCAIIDEPDFIISDINSDSDDILNESPIKIPIINQQLNEPTPNIFKRAPYHHYQNCSCHVDHILRLMLSSTEHGIISKISRESGIPKSTLSRWRRMS